MCQTARTTVLVQQGYGDAVVALDLPAQLADLVAGGAGHGGLDGYSARFGPGEEDGRPADLAAPQTRQCLVGFA